VSRISPKKTKSNVAAEVTDKAPQVDTENFFQAVIERRITDAEKELDTIRTTIPATETGRGYLKALEGLLLTAKSNDDKYLYLFKVEKTPKKLKALRKEFAIQGTNRLHAGYDIGYFQALENFIRKLERSDIPQEPTNEKENIEKS
jgi:hypothetical protein